MSFWNFLRESGDQRTLDNVVLQGWVINNMDPMQLQRVKVRVHDLHDDIADTDLPWFTPYQLAAFSGNANVGDHGPIPQVGTKVWVKFTDNSQYHGVYGGGVANSQNQVPEFAGQTKAPVSLPGGIPWDFSKNYPWSHGRIDDSGHAKTHDMFTDIISKLHVSATGHAIDGKGNFSADINGNVNRPDNPNAKSLFPTGGSVRVFGNLTLYVSGNINISAIGNTAITSNGSTTIDSQNTVMIRSAGEIDICNTGGQTLNVSSSTKIAFQAPTITSSVAITIAGGKQPSNPSTVTTQKAPQARTRPNPQVVANDESF
jgi:Type VI secretion system/phage-baseplate injector OB domain